jgi:hypothetical protein
MLKSLRAKIVRLLLATAVAIILIGSPSVIPAYAGDCGTGGSHNTGG